MQRATGDLSLIKKINTAIVLEAVIGMRRCRERKFPNGRDSTKQRYPALCRI